jgi:hypothetical protein
METKQYSVRLYGCDDSTYFDMALTDQELAFLKRVSELSKAASQFACQPILAVRATEDVYIIGCMDDFALFWNTETGWSNRTAATEYTEAQTKHHHLPIGGFWMIRREGDHDKPSDVR